VPKTKCDPSAENRLATSPAGSAPFGPSDPLIPSIRLPSGSLRGTLVEPSAKQGAHVLGPPKAKESSWGSASSRWEANGPTEIDRFEDIPT
jgi:hypothetical protein